MSPRFRVALRFGPFAAACLFGFSLALATAASAEEPLPLAGEEPLPLAGESPEAMAALLEQAESDFAQRLDTAVTAQADQITARALARQLEFMRDGLTPSAWKVTASSPVASVAPRLGDGLD